MRKVILQVELEPGDATIPAVRRKLRLKEPQIDQEFGVKQLRPGKNQYAIRVDADVAEAVRGEGSRKPEGGQVGVALVH